MTPVIQLPPRLSEVVAERTGIALDRLCSATEVETIATSLTEWSADSVSFIDCILKEIDVPAVSEALRDLQHAARQGHQAVVQA